MTATDRPPFIVPLILPVYPLRGTEHLEPWKRAAHWLLAQLTLSPDPLPMAAVLCQFPHHEPEQFDGLNQAILNLEKLGLLARDLYTGDLKPITRPDHET